MSHYNKLSPFTNLPPEILDAIAFELATLQFLGPPSILLPLLTTCVCFYNALSPLFNPSLWARIFRSKFDVGAVKRRSFLPTPEQYLEQLVRYCHAMQILRSGNRFHEFDTYVVDGEDMSLDEALIVALVMMLEDDGKNACQLVNWARADILADNLVRNTMFLERRFNHGWPVGNQRNACALWLLWMFTSHERLQNETKLDRDRLIDLLLPFVTFPYRYPTAEAPPQYFRLPLPNAEHNLPLAAPELGNTVNTTHGPYPVWPPPDRAIYDVHYASRPLLNVPLAALAARLLVFARLEMIPVGTPPHLARNREELGTRVRESNDPHAWASTVIEDFRGEQILIIGPTKDDIDEYNWGWTTRLPLTLRTGDRKVIGESLDPSFFSSGPLDVSRQSSLNSNDLVSGAHPRWAGKAPHSSTALPSKPKSALWDSDLWRLRLCGDLRVAAPKVPYGKVYEPGCMNGIWQGKMLIPHHNSLRHLLADPHFPGTEAFKEAAVERVAHPFYVRFREAYSIVGFDPSSQTSDASDYDDSLGAKDGGNMDNAWFDGMPGTTSFNVREALPAELPPRLPESRSVDTEVVEIEVTDMKERKRKKIISLSPRLDSPLLGNGAAQTVVKDDGVEVQEWEGFPHDLKQCQECQGRKRVRRRLERELAEERRRHRHEAEAMFASMGLGFDFPRHSRKEVDESAEESSGYQEEEEEDQNDRNGAADVPGIPLPHDPSRIAYGRCDGIKEIFLIGETDGRHRDAWGGYEFYGRVRLWDGFICVLRRPKERGLIAEGGAEGNLLFYGYLVGGENWVGSWRYTTADSRVVGCEGAFVMSRRLD